MHISVKYFGKLMDITSLQEEVIEMKNGENLRNAIDFLEKKHPFLASQVYAMFINKKKVDKLEHLLKDADELILMPPYSGG